MLQNLLLRSKQLSITRQPSIHNTSISSNLNVSSYVVTMNYFSKLIILELDEDYFTFFVKSRSVYYTNI